MDQIFVTKYSEDNISHDTNTIEFICVFLTQLMPSHTYKIRNELKRIVYS